MKESYSKSAKAVLLSGNEKKKKCCARLFSDVLELQNEQDSELRREKMLLAREHMKCSSCFSYFLRGLFICFGNVTDPSKAYHLELSFKTDCEQMCAFDILNENGIEMKLSKRKNRHLLYIKDSALIEDFFAVIGANKLAFDLMNSKIVREVRENTNRQINCDMANIQKSLSAAEKYIEIIEYLKECGADLRMSYDLQETAKVRLENTQVSLSELGRLHNPPISKSGVKHRLDKIVAFYQDMINK